MSKIAHVVYGAVSRSVFVTFEDGGSREVPQESVTLTSETPVVCATVSPRGDGFRLHHSDGACSYLDSENLYDPACTGHPPRCSCENWIYSGACPMHRDEDDMRGDQYARDSALYRLDTETLEISELARTCKPCPHADECTAANDCLKPDLYKRGPL